MYHAAWVVAGEWGERAERVNRRCHAGLVSMSEGRATVVLRGRLTLHALGRDARGVRLPRW